MKKLHKYGLIYTFSILIFILLHSLQPGLVQWGILPYFTPLYNIIVLLVLLSVIPIIITIVMIFREKVKLTKIFGGISSILMVISLILYLTSNFFYDKISEVILIINIILLVTTGGLSSFIILKVFLLKSEEEDILLIKKTILDLSTKFTRLRVQDITEKCKVDDATVIKIIRSMIKNNEIYADYFKSSQTVAFDQQRNMDEIDELMKTYMDWKEEKIGKED